MLLVGDRFLTYFENKIHIEMKHNPLFTILLFISILSLIGCGKKTDEQKHNTIYVDIEKRDKVSFFDIFSHAELIPLETNDQSLIKGINKIITHDDIYYILDYQKSEILMFDAKGKYINKISDRGEGPEEYLHANDFEIDEENKTLTILAPIKNSLFKYDLKGNFINKIKLPEITGAYKSFISLNSDTIVFFTFDYNNRIKLYSKRENRIVKELLPESDNMLDRYASKEFPYDKYIHRGTSNTILKIDDNGDLVDGYTWDFGNLNNTESQIENVAKLDGNQLPKYLDKFRNSEFTNHIMTFQGGNSRYLFTHVLRKGKNITIFHNKKNGKNYVFEKTTEDLILFPLVWNDEYVTSYFEQAVVSHEEMLPDDILNDRNIKIRDNWGEFDNPILVKYYFK
jgi:hypothetical protein